VYIIENYIPMRRILIPLLLTALFGAHVAHAHTINLSSIFEKEKFQTGAGVAVSPAHMHFNAEPGSEESQTLTINNDTEKEQTFTITMQDFNMNKAGKTAFVKAGTGEFGLSKFVSFSPSFVKLKPGEKKEVKVTVSLPNSEAARKAAWCVIMVEQARPKTKLDPADKGSDAVALGVYPTFAFGIFLYQNPPNVAVNQVEIVDFKTVRRTDGKDIIQLDATNNGDGISYCTTYIEIVDLKTGESVKLPQKNFTIVPGLRREFKFVLPKGFPEGEYNAIGVIDYGSKEEILTAELEFSY